MIVCLAYASIPGSSLSLLHPPYPEPPWLHLTNTPNQPGHAPQPPFPQTRRRRPPSSTQQYPHLQPAPPTPRTATTPGRALRRPPRQTRPRHGGSGTAPRQPRSQTAAPAPRTGCGRSAPRRPRPPLPCVTAASGCAVPRPLPSWIGMLSGR